MPHQAAGPRMEPPVSEPMAPRHRPAATAAAEPEDEPDGSCSGFQGLRAGGHGRSKLVPPMANSQVASLPVKMAPAWASLLTQVASVVGTWSWNKAEWPVVAMPAVL